MNELLQPILALGGFGYLNYILYRRISDRNFGDNLDKKFFIGAISSVNYTIYLIWNFFIQNILFSIILAVLTSFMLTIVLPEIVDKTFKFTNRYRNEKEMSEQVTKKVYKHVFDTNKPRTLFIFSIPDNKLIAAGYAKLFSGEHEELSFDITPLYWNDPTKNIFEESTLIDLLDQKNIEADTYINFDKKIKIINFEFLEDEKDEEA